MSVASDKLAPGFAEPVLEAQSSFRRALTALSEPGRVIEVSGPAEAALPPAITALALTLADYDTPLWLDGEAAAGAAYLAFHCGAPPAESHRQAAFACILDPQSMPPLSEFPLGSDAYPDRSATLFIEVGGLAEAGPLAFGGPGIDGTRNVAIDGLPQSLLEQRTALETLYPRGLDIFFTCGSAVMGLPRSTRIGA